MDILIKLLARFANSLSKRGRARAFIVLQKKNPRSIDARIRIMKRKKGGNKRVIE